jgi:hypothetical protein
MSYASDSTIIAAAENAVIRGEMEFTVELCGTDCNWRQRRLFESAMQAAMFPPGPERDAALRNVDRFRTPGPPSFALAPVGITIEKEAS